MSLTARRTARLYSLAQAVADIETAPHTKSW
jgi:hypothetical protein